MFSPLIPSNLCYGKDSRLSAYMTDRVKRIRSTGKPAFKDCDVVCNRHAALGNIDSLKILIINALTNLV